MTSNTAFTASLFITTICDNISLGLRGQKVHEGASCSYGNVYRWAGSAVVQVVCMVWE